MHAGIPSATQSQLSHCTWSSLCLTGTGPHHLSFQGAVDSGWAKELLFVEKRKSVFTSPRFFNNIAFPHRKEKDKNQWIKIVLLKEIYFWDTWAQRKRGKLTEERTQTFLEEEKLRAYIISSWSTQVNVQGVEWAHTLLQSWLCSRISLNRLCQSEEEGNSLKKSVFTSLLDQPHHLEKDLAWVKVGTWQVSDLVAYFWFVLKSGKLPGHSINWSNKSNYYNLWLPELESMMIT